MADVLLMLSGSLVIIEPLSLAAEEWLEDNMAEDASWCMRGVVAEPRYACDIVEAMEADGFSIDKL